MFYGDYTFRGENWIMYRVVEPCVVLLKLIHFMFVYTSIKRKEKKRVCDFFRASFLVRCYRRRKSD